MASSPTMARAVVIAAVLLVQCCNVVLAARLLEGDRGWLYGGVGAPGRLSCRSCPAALREREHPTAAPTTPNTLPVGNATAS